MAPQAGLRRQGERDLAQARRGLDNVLDAIRAGLATPATKNLLEDRERRVAILEATLAVPDVVPRSDVLPDRVDGYLRNLQGTLTTDPAAARSLLASLL